jgi:pyridoxal phosphate enzyme (YggS family)
MTTSLSENVARVRERIEAACRRVGRSTESVRIVAATKTVAPERLRQAYAAGIRDFGENRVQEARPKRAALSDLPVTWHLIGRLQSNKARAARELFDWVHSVDSQHLAEKLDKAAGPNQHRMPVLIEVNLGEEAAKAGAHDADVLHLAETIASLGSVELRGLMAIPPFSEDPEQARPYFRRLRELAARIETLHLPGASLRELSMGMSQDFEIAIEEGATIIRVGSAIFGPRA